MGRQKRLQKLKRRRKRGLSTRQRVTLEHWENRSESPLYLSEILITWEPLQSDAGKADVLKHDVGKDRVEEIHSMIYDDPASAIKELEPLLDRYPHVPALYNWLAASYGQLGNLEKGEEFALLNYQRHPNYFFSRINYAGVLLNRGEVEQVAKLFNDTWDLALLYPGRKKFHISEVVAFQGIAFQYMMRTGDLETADTIYELMEHIAPDDRQTAYMRRLIRGPFFLRLTRRLLSWAAAGSRRHASKAAFTSS